jgi:hypothetical protein
MSSDNAKRRDIVRTARLEWQGELDSAMAAIDSRLTHPRRRATDKQLAELPRLPELGDGELTSELLDEVAWRVAEEIRRNPPESVTPQPPAPVVDAPPADEQLVLRPGKMLMIRYRMPLLPWPLRLLQRRRKQHPLTTAKV